MRRAVGGLARIRQGRQPVPDRAATPFWACLRSVATLALGLALAASGVGAAESGTGWPPRLTSAENAGGTWDYEVINGLAIHDGDIILGPAPDVDRARTLPAKRDGGTWPERRDVSYGTVVDIEASGYASPRPWPDGVIPYVLDSSFASEPLLMEVLEEEIDFWHAHTVVRWVPRTTEDVFLRMSVENIDSAGLATLGYHDRSSPILIMDSELFTTSGWAKRWIYQRIRSVLNHEMGHVVGLWHEHERADAQKHLRMTFDYGIGISPVSCRAIFHPNKPNQGPFDYASIMMYGTVVAKPGNIPVGDDDFTDRPSVGDIDGINRLYGSPPQATTISTHPPRQLVTVDGEVYRTPITFSWPVGSRHLISAPLTMRPDGALLGSSVRYVNITDPNLRAIYTSGQTRYAFARWSDGGAIQHSFTASPDVTWLTAYYANVGPPDELCGSHLASNSDPLIFDEVEDVNTSKWTPVFSPETDAGKALIHLRGDRDLTFSPVPLERTDHYAGIAVSSVNSSSASSVTYAVGTSVNFSARSCVERGLIPVWFGHGIPEQQFGNTDQSVVAGFGRQVVRLECVSSLDRFLTEDHPKKLEIPERSAGEMYVVPYYPEMDRFTVDLISSQPADLDISGDLPSTFQRMPWGFRAVVELETYLDARFRGDASSGMFRIWVRSPTGKALSGSWRVHTVERRHGPVRIADRSELLFAAAVDAIPRAQTIWVKKVSSEISAVKLESDGPSILTSPPEGLLLADSRFHSIQFAPSAMGLAPGVHKGRVRVVPVGSPAASSGIGRVATSEEVPFSLIVAEPDTITKIEFTQPPFGDTFRYGEYIAVQPHFFCPPDRTDFINFGLDIGGQERYVETSYYQVQASDRDTDGALITTMQVGLPGGAVEVDVNQLGPFLTTAKVDGSQAPSPRVTIQSGPLDGNAYRAGERIYATVSFGVPAINLNWTSTPTLTLDIGQHRVQATLEGEPPPSPDTDTMVFRYQVQASDRDTDGISIAADALSRNNGETVTGSWGGSFDVDVPLNLGENALVNFIGARVDGSRRVPAPSVVQVQLGGSSDHNTGRPEDEIGVIGYGDDLSVVVHFDQNVEVTGSPELTVAIGDRRVQATLAGDHDTEGGTRTKVLFRYSIQAQDLGTVSVPLDDTGSLMLSGGTVRGERSGREARFNLGAETFVGVIRSEWDNRFSRFPKVNGRLGTPELREVEITSQPFGGDAYGRGERISIVLRYSQPIKVTGIPVLSLQIGQRRIPVAGRIHSDAHGVYRNTLGFSYEVQAGDRDADGISITSDALSVFGGLLLSAARESFQFQVPLALGWHAVSNAPGHRVNSAAPLRVLRIQDSRSSSFSAIRIGECAYFYVRFSEDVTLTGESSLELTLLIGNRRVTIQPTPRTLRLWRERVVESLPHIRQTLPGFLYCVEAGDFDSDGVEVVALALNGGTLRDRYGVDVDLDLGHLGQSYLKVDGRPIEGAPQVTGVNPDGGSPPLDGTTYQDGEILEVVVQFDPPVANVTGNPRLALMIGDRQVEARHKSLYQGQATFTYSVKPGDRDADGYEIPITDGMLPITGGTLHGEDGTEANLAWGSSVTSQWMVDGSELEVPSVDVGARVEIRQVVSGTDTGRPGEKALELVFGFTASLSARTYSELEVTGSPQLTVEIGSRRLQLPLSSARPRPVSDFFAFLDFSSFVVPPGELESEVDSRGELVVRFPQDPLSLNGGTIRGVHPVTGAVLAYSGKLSHPGREQRLSWSVINGRGIPRLTGLSQYLPFSSRGVVHRLGEPLNLCADFSVPVEVTGSPQLALEIGDRRAHAAFSSLLGSKTVCFRYFVQAGDRAEDGIEIPGNPISLNGGTIRGWYGDDAFLLLERSRHFPRPKVDGSLAIAPTVTGAVIHDRLGIDGFNDYGPGEEIFLQVIFDARVEVTGSPRLALEIGDRRVRADFVDVSHNDFNKWVGNRLWGEYYPSLRNGNALYFRYVVQAGDLAENGIRLPENPLSLNGGTIGNGAFDADIAIDPNLLGRINSSASFRSPIIGGVPKIERIWAGVSGTFVAGQSLARDSLFVRFDRPVVVTGSPRLTLEIGGRRVEATFHRMTYDPGRPRRRSRRMVFRYVVQAGDLDEDGIAVPENPLSLNGGTIRSRHGIDANLETPGIGPLTHVKVDGSSTGQP